MTDNRWYFYGWFSKTWQKTHNPISNLIEITEDELFLEMI